MTDSASPTPANHKPTLAPGQKIFLRISGVIAMALFLLPTFYLLKYYAFDSARESRQVGQTRTAINNDRPITLPNNATAGDLPVLAEVAHDAHDPAMRVTAIQEIGRVLGNTSVNFERPMECLQAKSALAEIAAHDSNATVKSAAQEEIGKIAQGGAVVRR
jgi:hypothetical protein